MDLAKHFNIPIINADSRQIYRELKIGTARPSNKQMSEVKHYFVGTLGMDDYYSASLYEQQVLTLLDEIFKTSDYALLSGGSMMYIDAVCNGIDDIPTIDDETRATLKNRLLGLTRPREELYKRINRRVDKMMKDGLLEEAKEMYPKREVNALNTVGYKELFEYLKGKWTLHEAVERIKGNTRRYARKQLTWYKKDEQIRWFHPDDKEDIISYIEQQN